MSLPESRHHSLTIYPLQIKFLSSSPVNQEPDIGMYVSICIYACKYVSKYVCMYACVCMYVCICVYVYSYV